MQWLLSVILALHLAQGDVTPTVPLSREAWAGYQFYLLSMGAGTGAFAVSPDGTAWAFSYCEFKDCTRDNRALALSKCEERTDFTCLIFAQGDKIALKFVQP